MKFHWSAPLLALLLCSLLTACGDVGPKKSVVYAEKIFTNGKIYTMDTALPVASAVAIGGGKILSVGDADSVERFAGAQTEIIDLARQTVLPGFHDLHVHPIFAGLFAFTCSVAQGADLEQLLEKVKSCAEQAGDGDWITGGQWDTPALGQVPNRKLLDAIVPDIPVFLRDTSGHSAWANTRALEVAGINSETPDPEGGIIERDAMGEPTGLLREMAAAMVVRHIPPHSDETLDAALATSLSTMLANGLTTFTEAAIGFNAGAKRDTETYTRLADAGLLKQRVRLCITWSPDDSEAEALLAAREQYTREGLSLDCVKMFLDGVPTDSHTAAMLEPYEGTVEGRSDEASVRGMLLMDQSILNEAVARFDKMGFTVKFHAAGDAAVRAGLEAIAYARGVNGMSNLRHNTGHCTFVAREDMPKALAINATFEVSPYLWSPSPINDSITQAVGEARIKRVWPVRELMESGALVVPGSDWAVVPSVNPWLAIEALVTREEPGGSVKNFGKEQAISVVQAIELFTVNSAKQRGMEDKLGQISEGMLADLIVIDRDPYQIPVAELHRVVVNQTVINGAVVYDRGSGAVLND